MRFAARAIGLLAAAILVPACDFSFSTVDPAPARQQNPFVLQIPYDGQTGVWPTNTQFAWTELAGAQSYDLELSLNPAFSPVLYSVTNLTVPTVILNVGLTQWTTYYWRVTGHRNTANWIADGSPFQFTTISLVFGVPNGFSLLSPIGGVTALSSTPLFLWTPSSGAAGYSLQIDDSSAFTSPLVDLTNLHLNQLPCPVVLNSGTTYYWRVKALNSSGSMDSSPPWASFVSP